MPWGKGTSLVLNTFPETYNKFATHKNIYPEGWALNMNQIGRNLAIGNSEKGIMVKKFKTARWVFFVMVSIVYMFATFQRIVPSVMGNAIQADINISATLWGTVGLAFTWTYAFAQGPVGTFLDKYGQRMGLSVILILSAIGCLVFGAAHSSMGIILGRVLVALAISGFMVAGAKTCANWFTTKEYVVVYAIFMGLGNLGSLLATTPMQLLMNFCGWRHAVIYFVGGVSLLMAVVVALFLRDTPDKMGLQSPEKILETGITKSSKVENKAAVVENISAGEILRSPIVWICACIALGSSASGQTLQSLWIGIYMHTLMPAVPAITISNVLLCASIGLMLGSISAGFFTNRYTLTRTLIGSNVLFLVFWAFMAFNAGNMTVASLMVTNFFLGFAQMLTVTTNFMLIRELFPKSRLGTALGFTNTFIWVFGAGLCQQLWGFILDVITKGGAYTIPAFAACFKFQLIYIIVATGAAYAVYRMARQGKITSEHLI